MIGNDLSSIKSMLTNAFTKAAEAKEKAGSAPDAAASASAAPKDASDPAFLLSANLQDLTKHLKGMSEGASDGAKDGIARAEDALGQMRGVLEFTDAFAEQLEGVLDAMAEDFGRTLKAFGLDEEEQAKAVEGFKDHFGKDRQARAVAAYAEEEHQSTSVSVEVRNIELTIEQGDKKLSISFDSASLSLSELRERDAVAIGPDGVAVESERSATRLDARSTGLTVQAEGFGEEELKGVMAALDKVMASKDPAAAFQGMAVLKPTDAPREGEPFKLSLDLMGAIKSAFAGGQDAPAQANDTKPKGMDILA